MCFKKPRIPLASPLDTLPTLRTSSTNSSALKIPWPERHSLGNPGNKLYLLRTFLWCQIQRPAKGQVISSSHLKHLGDCILALQYQVHRTKFQRPEILKFGCISGSFPALKNSNLNRPESEAGNICLFSKTFPSDSDYQPGFETIDLGYSFTH